MQSKIAKEDVFANACRKKKKKYIPTITKAFRLGWQRVGSEQPVPHSQTIPHPDANGFFDKPLQ